MDLNEETFPEIDLIPDEPEDVIGPHIYIYNNSPCDQNSLSPQTGSEENSSGQSSSSGLSSQGKFSVQQQEKGIKLKGSNATNKSTLSGKAQSFQDIHSYQTKKRYQHVKSKVGQYIVNMKAQEQRKQQKKITRHNSLPETLSGCNDFQNSNNSDKDTNIDTDLFRKLVQNNEEMMQLRTLNEYLQENLQEKMSQLVRLKRNADSMRIELLQMKEKQQQNRFSLSRYDDYSGRHSLPLLSFEISTKTSIATQTVESIISRSDISSSREESDNILQAYDNTSNFLNTKDTIKQNGSDCHVRKRTNSNSSKYEMIVENSQQNSIGELKSHASDSAIDSEEENRNGSKTGVRMESKYPGGPKKKRRKCKLLRKKSWRKFVFGSCTMAIPCCDKNDSYKDEYSYTQISITENECSRRSEGKT